MGAVDSVPVVSQTKSAVQAVCGDVEGARTTQENFLDTCPVVSQGKSIVQWANDDAEGARQTQLKFAGSLSDFADEKEKGRSPTGYRFTALPVSGYFKTLCSPAACPGDMGTEDLPGTTAIASREASMRPTYALV